MTSILKVSEIQDPTNSNTAITIASDGTVTMPENDSGWIAPTLNSPYANFGSGWAEAEYRKINNIVCIQGLLQINSAGFATTIFTLPSGYRPKAQLMFSVLNDNKLARLDVNPTGAVIYRNGSNITGWLSIFVTFMVA